MVINACATAARDILHDCMHAHPKQKPKTTQAFTHMLVSQALILQQGFAAKNWNTTSIMSSNAHM